MVSSTTLKSTFRRRTQAPKPSSRIKTRSSAAAAAASEAKGSSVDVCCEECGSGDIEEELLLRPILACVPKGPWFCRSCSHNKNKHLTHVRKKRKRSGSLVVSKKKRKLLAFHPSESLARRLEQMASLATVLTASGSEFSNELTYMPGMAPRSANHAILEREGMQVLSRDDTDTLNICKSMIERGEWPPLMVVFDSCEGFTVEADGFIKDLTIITEYAGDVDYLKNREEDDSDSMMTLISAKDPSKSLAICPDKRSNIARFINGINNHTQ